MIQRRGAGANRALQSYLTGTVGLATPCATAMLQQRISLCGWGGSSAPAAGALRMASNCFSGAYRVLFFPFGDNAWCQCDLILSLALLCPAWFCSPCCCPNKRCGLLALVFCNTRGVRQLMQVVQFYGLTQHFSYKQPKVYQSN